VNNPASAGDDDAEPDVDPEPAVIREPDPDE
jgi:hypothetical protein